MNVFTASSSAQSSARKVLPRHIQVVFVIDDMIYVSEFYSIFLSDIASFALIL